MGVEAPVEKQVEIRPGTTPRKSDRWLMATVVLVALAVRLFYWVGIEAYPKFELIKNRLDDQVVFDAWAKSIVHGERFDYTSTGHEFAHWVSKEPGVYPQAPLYPFVVAAFYAVAGFDYDGLRLLQMVLGALACGLLYRLARRFMAPWAAVCCGLGLAFYGPQVFYEGTLLRASLFTTVGLVALERLYRLQDMLGVSSAVLGRWRPCGVAVTTGVALAAGVLMRPNFLLVAVVALSWLAWLSWPARKHGSRRRVLGWAVLGLIAPLLLIAAVNTVRSGHPACLSSNGPYIFFVGNVHDASGTSATPSPYYYEVKGRGPAAEVDLLAAALSDIGRHPRAFMALQGRKLLAFFGPRETPNNLSFEMALETNPRLRWAWLRLPFVLPWAVLGLVFARRRSHVLLHIFWGCYAVSTVLFYVLARLRLPVVPVLLILAAMALEGLWRSWQRPSRRPAVILATVVALGASLWLAAGPASSVRHRGSDYAMAAAAHVSRGQLAERSGDGVLARHHYGRALALNPQHGDALTSARRLAPGRSAESLLSPSQSARLHEARQLAEQDPKAAEKLLRHLARRAPEAPEPHHFLSNVAYLRGDLDAAGRHLEAAVERAPLVDLYRRNLTAVRRELLQRR